MATDISLLSLFSEATIVVKLIMVGLLAVSVVSWTFIFQHARYLKRLHNLEQSFEHDFSQTRDITELYKNFSSIKSNNLGLIEIFKAGFAELFVNKNPNSMQKEIMLENTKRAMSVAMSKELSSLEQNLSFLATVGSVSPYVGLFGTVWGIMHSFIALGSVQNATLSMVAPGIAEALIATAIGLFAAIPAVMAYNRFANNINELENKYERFKINFTNILARQIYS